MVISAVTICYGNWLLIYYILGTHSLLSMTVKSSLHIFLRCFNCGTEKVRKFPCWLILPPFGKLVHKSLCLGSAKFSRLWLEGWCRSVIKPPAFNGKSISNCSSSPKKKPGLVLTRSCELCGRA